MRRRTTPKQRGSTILESSLILGVFLFVCIGIMDFAQFLHIHQAVVERVRSSARTAAVDQLTAEQLKNLIVYGDAGYSGDATSGYFGLTRGNVTVNLLDADTTEQRAEVLITGLRFPVLSPLIAGRGRIIPVRVTVSIEAP